MTEPSISFGPPPSTLNVSIETLNTRVDAVESSNASKAPQTALDAEAATRALAVTGVVKRGRVVSPRQFAGVTKPTFRGGLGLGSITPGGSLAVDASGYLVANAATVFGQGDVKLPFTLDRTQPFAACFLVEIGATDDTGILQIWLTNSADTNYGAFWQIGATLYGGSVGSNQNYAATPFGGAVPPGLYEFYVHSDGVRFRSAIKKASLAPYAQSTQLPGYDQGVVGPVQTQLRYDAANPSWASVNMVRFKTSSITHKIRGGWVSLDSVARPPGAICGQATYIPILTPTDYAEVVRVPKTYDGRSPIDLILIGHPNGSSESLGANYSDQGGGTGFHAGLLDAGYLMGYVRGDSGSFTTAAASPWGSNAGQVPRIAFLDYLLAQFPQIRNVYWLGQSMGFLDGLNLHLNYPGLLRAIVGVAGVCNLAHAYNTGGFSAVINTGHGTASLAAVADRDPLLRAGDFASLPMQGWHGTSDATVAKASHQDLFAAAVAAAGGSFDARSVAGGGHLDATMMNGVATADVVAFLAVNAT